MIFFNRRKQIKKSNDKRVNYQPVPSSSPHSGSDDSIAFTMGILTGMAVSDSSSNPSSFDGGGGDFGGGGCSSSWDN